MKNIKLSKRSSNGYWFIEFHDQGNRIRKSTGTKNKREAMQALVEYSHTYKLPVKTSKHQTLYDFSISYKVFSEANHSKRHQRNVKYSFKNFNKHLSNKLLNKYTSEEIEAFINTESIRTSHSALLQYKTMKSAFNRAVKWKLLDKNPFDDVEIPRVVELSQDWINKRELNLILPHIDKLIFKYIILTAFDTGMRLGELVHLQWKNVNLNECMICVANSKHFTTKNRKKRIIPMTDSVKALFIELYQKKRSNNSFVFYKDYPDNHWSENYVSTIFRRGVVKAKSNDNENERLATEKTIHFHSLRHSFCSRLAMAGESIYAIQKLAGHSSIKLTERYSHLQPSNLVSVISKLNTSIEHV